MFWIICIICYRISYVVFRYLYQQFICKLFIYLRNVPIIKTWLVQFRDLVANKLCNEIKLLYCHGVYKWWIANKKRDISGKPVTYEYGYKSYPGRWLALTVRTFFTIAFRNYPNWQCDRIAQRCWYWVTKESFFFTCLDITLYISGKLFARCDWSSHCYNN